MGFFWFFFLLCWWWWWWYCGWCLGLGLVVLCFWVVWFVRGGWCCWVWGLLGWVWWILVDFLVGRIFLVWLGCVRLLCWRFCWWLKFFGWGSVVVCLCVWWCFCWCVGSLCVLFVVCMGVFVSYVLVFFVCCCWCLGWVWRRRIICVWWWVEWCCVWFGCFVVVVCYCRWWLVWIVYDVGGGLYFFFCFCGFWFWFYGFWILVYYFGLEMLFCGGGVIFLWLGKLVFVKWKWLCGWFVWCELIYV